MLEEILEHFLHARPNDGTIRSRCSLIDKGY